MRPRLIVGAWIFDVFAGVYAAFTAQETWRASCARLAAHLPDSTSGRRRIADLGCGPGVSTIELARLRPDDQLLGLDLAPRMLQEARRRAASAGLLPGRVTWVRGDAARLPFGSGSLDALTGHSFLYLLPDRDAALAEMHRVLRPGGRVVLMEPNEHPSSLSRALRLSRHPGYWLSVALWRPFSLLHGRFTPTTLCETLESAHFTDCVVEEAVGGLGLMARADKPNA